MPATTGEVHMSQGKETVPGIGIAATALARAARTTHAATAEQLIALKVGEVSAGAKLAHVILADLPLTARLLRALNSHHCNPDHARIATISGAVGSLGFHGVRRVALVIALLEDCARGRQRARAQACFARSIHAASQARGLAAYRADIDPEEVFIVALLRDAGELQFWCSGDSLAAQIDRAFAEPGADPKAVEERIFGGSLAARAAALNPFVPALSLLRAALADTNGNDPRVRCIHLAHALARCAEEGWPGEPMQQLSAQAVSEMHVPVSEISTALRKHAHEAACLAAACEAVDISRLIRRP